MAGGQPPAGTIFAKALKESNLGVSAEEIPTARSETYPPCHRMVRNNNPDRLHPPSADLPEIHRPAGKGVRHLVME